MKINLFLGLFIVIIFLFLNILNNVLKKTQSQIKIKINLNHIFDYTQNEYFFSSLNFKAKKVVN